MATTEVNLFTAHKRLLNLWVFPKKNLPDGGNCIIKMATTEVDLFTAHKRSLNLREFPNDFLQMATLVS